MPINHHVRMFETNGKKTAADCGSTSWSWATTDWNSVTCTACLEKRPAQQKVAKPKPAQQEATNGN